MDKPWRIFINQQPIDLSNLDYLNYLLQNSHEAIKAQNFTRMIYVKSDFEEIKEHQSLFYTLFKLQIDSEISDLNRLLKTEVQTYSSFQENCRVKTFYNNLVKSRFKRKIRGSSASSSSNDSISAGNQSPSL